MKHPTLHIEIARAEKERRGGGLLQKGGPGDENRLETAKRDGTSEVW